MNPAEAGSPLMEMAQPTAVSVVTRSSGRESRSRPPETHVRERGPDPTMIEETPCPSLPAAPFRSRPTST
ncbi:hypothetical protein GCM10023237_65600 [Streptomyces coeruleoprunus]